MYSGMVEYLRESLVMSILQNSFVDRTRLVPRRSRKLLPLFSRVPGNEARIELNV